jgi:hypothetical protein
MTTEEAVIDSKPIILHIGDPVKYNPDTFERFSSTFHVIRPSLAERQRDEFKRALKEKRWGDFSAIFRPHWGSGGEMGRWDAELVPLLPKSVKVFASAGAGFDWADVDVLADHGKHFPDTKTAAAVGQMKLRCLESFINCLLIYRHHLLQQCLSLHRSGRRLCPLRHLMHLSRTYMGHTSRKILFE